jgi:hypothetical protein
MATPEELIERLRNICLALPNTSEKPYHGAPSLRIPKRAFALFEDDHHDSGRLALWAAADEGAQEFLVESDPCRYFVPPYLGPGGWVGLRLDGKVDWDEVAGLVEDAYDAVNY